MLLAELGRPGALTGRGPLPIGPIPLVRGVGTPTPVLRALPLPPTPPIGRPNPRINGVLLEEVRYEADVVDIDIEPAPPLEKQYRQFET